MLSQRSARRPARCRPPATARPNRDGHGPADGNAPPAQGSRPASPAVPPWSHPGGQGDPLDPRAPGPRRWRSGLRRHGGGCAAATPAQAAHLATSSRVDATGRRCRTDHRGGPGRHPPKARPDPPTSAGPAEPWPLPLRAAPLDRPEPASRQDKSTEAATGATGHRGAKSPGHGHPNQDDAAHPRGAGAPAPGGHWAARTATGAGGPTANVNETFQSGATGLRHGPQASLDSKPSPIG